MTGVLQDDRAREAMPRVLTGPDGTWLVVALLAGFMLLPRLMSAQFGLFDDSLTVWTARTMEEEQWWRWDPQKRFRPVYWLLWWGLYRGFGARAWPWFFVQGLLLVASALLLLRLTRGLGAGRLGGAVAATLFVLSPATVEGYYTLSKGEPLQAFWLLVALNLALGPMPVHPVSRIGRVSAIGLCGLLAAGSKENAIVLAPIALAWLVLDALAGDWLWSRSRQGFALGVLVPGSVLGTLGYLALRQWAAGSLMSGGYTSAYAAFTLATGFYRAQSWAARVLQVFPALAPALVVLAVAAVRPESGYERPTLLFWGLWMSAWVAFTLPVRFVVNYYLLPFSVGAGPVVGAAVERAVAWLRLERPSGRLAGGLALFLLAVTLVMGAATGLADGRVQLAIDRANASMLAWLAERSPEGRRIQVNMRERTEYVDRIESYLAELLGRPDLRVEPLTEDTRLTWPAEDTALLVPVVGNQPAMTVRLGVIEEVQPAWNEALIAQTGPLGEPVYEVMERVRLYRFEPLRLACSVARLRDYCESPGAWLDLRTFAYGWRVYLSSGDHPR